jgi:hypothetical protein
VSPQKQVALQNMTPLKQVAMNDDPKKQVAMNDDTQKQVASKVGRWGQNYGCLKIDKTKARVIKK